MQYDWYKKELEVKLRELKRLRETASTEKRKIINETISTIEDIFAKPNRLINYTLEDRLLYEYQNIIEFRPLWDLCESLADLSDDEILNLPYPEIDLKDKEILELTHDFFKNATPSWIYELFMKLFKQRKNIHFINYNQSLFYADTVFLKYYNACYIQMARKYEFNDIPILAHEFGHGIQFLSNYHENIFDNLLAFSEIVSSFFEFICGYYYTKDSTLGSKAIINNYITWDSACCTASSLVEEIQILKSIDISFYETKLDLYQNIKKFIASSDQNNLWSLLATEPSADFIYIIAYTIVTQLVMIYIKDQDYAFYLLKKLMEIDLRLSQDQYLDALLDIGLLPTESVGEYNCYVKKELTRLKKV